MDPETLRMIATILQGGGPLVTIFAIWIAFKAGQSAREAVKALLEIREAVTKSAPKIDSIATELSSIGSNIKAIDKRTEEMEDSFEELRRDLRRGVPA